MEFASALKFEVLIARSDEAVDALAGNVPGDTRGNIKCVVRLAVASTEYNQRNGIAVPKYKQAVYDKLPK
jgi:hypothetical protein